MDNLDLQQLMRHLGATDEDMADHLMFFALEAYEEHKMTGSVQDIDVAIRASRLALSMTPGDHPDRVGFLNKHGGFLEARYGRKGQMTDLEEGIDVARQAVESAPEGHPERPACFNNLGTKLYERYERTGQTTDLEEAIDAARQAVKLTPKDHREREACLNNLGNYLLRRYERTGERSDLNEAIEVARQAVQLAPNRHPNRAVCLNNLGAMLARRYEWTDQIADLDEAIEVARQALALTPEDHPMRALWMDNLGISLRSRHERTGRTIDLRDAIDASQQAIELIPKDHPNRASCLSNLAKALERRYELTGQMADLDDALRRLQEAWSCRAATPFRRVRAAEFCLRLLLLRGNFATASQVGMEVIDLLPTVNTRLLDRDDQEFVMFTFGGIAANLCASLMALNRPDDALQYLEKGRAVIIGQLVDSRSDVSGLAQQHPDIARRYERLRDEVNTPLRGVKGDAAGKQMLQRRRVAAAELDACVREIRGIAGHDRFLLGQTVDEMKECAAGGFIIVVNITEFRSDAIIISPATIRAINFEGLSFSEVKDWLGKDWGGRESEFRRKNDEYLRYLSWLWHNFVEQLLDEVSSLHTQSEGLPRVWWIGTGLASSMPFHAAGIHSPGSTDHAYSRAVSSYTPSIKALRHSKARAGSTEPITGGTLLMATMPTTPRPSDGGKKLCDLPGVTEEKARVINATKGHLTPEVLEHPSVEQVITRLQTCRVAHFACHGWTDHSDPSESGLVLQRQGAGGAAEQERLTVRRVSELSLRQARLAYLSACSTAENKTAWLADEVLHVVSGFQVAGFPHVVGCLWPSDDSVCVVVAERLYTSLFAAGRKGWSGGEVASALREAVMAVRAAEMDMPLLWAQFVHYGA
ncbi:907a84fc-40af-4c23-8109-9cb006c013ad [Thermothielavioides terrestris]|uniref:CHAT domain-containing protein n=2 Tax=Thermothielavioides terrestris TaxID=2587410 RepID=G2QS79_THETT|nr:uncharacterized protein THITE_2110237 [Thermothielavioides terrestris NRRL 8126]AEO64268.1 hypothetical protein THITE_2110237 [Thermothielavioides terrestris NRRL 8126]SPQ26885.1 907a84fc-40af-4c23-8109-9cb006c013ad [Thermothielavioides terrestris]